VCGGVRRAKGSEGTTVGLIYTLQTLIPPGNVSPDDYGQPRTHDDFGGDNGGGTGLPENFPTPPP